MCGIIGTIGGKPGAPLFIAGLKRFEYRGYDSAGVATLEHGVLTRRRAEDKLQNLEQKFARESLPMPSASATPAGRRTDGRTKPTRKHSLFVYFDGYPEHNAHSLLGEYRGEYQLLTAARGRALSNH